jgi:transposase
MTQEEELMQLRAEVEALRPLKERVAELEQQLVQMAELVKTLQDRQAKDSHNSSLPPSSDRFVRQKKTKSLRKKSDKAVGGQPGHRGQTLNLSATPDQVIRLAPLTCCQHCQADLSSIAARSLERRQVIDVPEPRPHITEYQGEWKCCPHCQGLTCAAFPAQVRAPVQYGPRISAIAVYLQVQQLLPQGRTANICADLLGIELSQGTLALMQARAASRLEPVEAKIKAALIQASVIHQDETGLYVEGKRWWMHGTSTATLTHYAAHPSRGAAALDAIGIAAHFQGTAVHDAWAAYFPYDYGHALCGVHLLRELTFLAEQDGCQWASDLSHLLQRMKATAEQARAHEQWIVPSADLIPLLDEYDQCLAQASLLHPHVLSPPGKRGRPKQSSARNLLDRLLTRKAQVLAFLLDLHVPFDNNLAEQDIRMVKVQQKVSGTFRSEQGAVSFCRIRGYLSTLRKQGLPLLDALVATFCGQPLLPAF